MKSFFAALVSTTATVLLLTACSTTPRANFYTLGGTVPATPDHARSDLVLAIGPVDLPQYLDRPHIVTRLGGNRLIVDEFNRWGGALEEDIARVLAEQIGGRLGTRRIYSYPSRVVAETDYRIALDIRAFDGVLGGEVGLDASWSVIEDHSGRVVVTDQARYLSASIEADYDAYAAALSDTLVQLGADLAAAIRGLDDAAKAR